MKTILVSALLAAAALLPPAAIAKSGILATATRVGNYESSSSSVAVPLDDNNDTSLSFKTTKSNTLVVISYNAECAAIGNTEGWVSAIITVDGQSTNPNSGSQFAMCTSSSSSTEIWTGAVRTVTYVVPSPGTHSVVVTGTINGVADMWFGDTSLIVSTAG